MDLPPAPAHPRRLVYLGTPAMAVPPLEALVAAGFDIPLVVSREDKRRGRGSTLTPSPVKAAAQALGLQVTSSLDEALGVEADLGVVVAYGHLIPTPVLAGLPMVNVHFSLLPRWRGAAPVERALLAGDTETGVCLMVVAPELDTGDVYARRAVPIGERATLAELQEELVAAGSRLLVDELTAGLGTPEPQRGEPTYAAKLDPEELRLHFDRSAVELDRVVRLGRAWTCFRGKRVKVLATEPAPARGGRVGELAGDLVATGDGWLRLVRVQPEGRRPMAAADWLHGVRPQPGERLG